MANRTFPAHDAWRTKNYSNIDERFIEKRSFWRKKWEGIDDKGLFYLYAVLALPFFLLIFIMMAARKYKFFRIALYVSYGMMLFLAKVMSSASSASGVWFAIYVVILALLSEAYISKSNGSLVSFNNGTRTNNTCQHITKNKVFGVVGDLTSARGKFSDENIALGEEGEIRTAAMLNDLLLIPGTRIFHGVHWPGSKNADIDHIAINGRKIALIDSKMWSGNMHTIISTGDVSSSQYGDRKPVIRTVKLPKAIISMTRHNYKQGVKKTDMHGWLAIHKLNKKSVKVNNKYNPGLPVTLGDAKDVINSLGTWFSDEKQLDGSIHQDIVDSIFSTMK